MPIFVGSSGISVLFSSWDHQKYLLQLDRYILLELWQLVSYEILHYCGYLEDHLWQQKKGCMKQIIWVTRLYCTHSSFQCHFQYGFLLLIDLTVLQLKHHPFVSWFQWAKTMWNGLLKCCLPAHCNSQFHSQISTCQRPILTGTNLLLLWYPPNAFWLFMICCNHKFRYYCCQFLKKKLGGNTTE